MDKFWETAKQKKNQPCPNVDINAGGNSGVFQ